MQYKKQLRCLNVGTNQGFIAILATSLVVIAMVSIGVSLAAQIIAQHKISSSSTKASQAYFAAEAGIEDAILRIQKGWLVPSSYTISFLGASDISANIQVSDPIGGSRTITSQGMANNISKKLRAVHSLSGEEVEFFFGAQVGAGGITMEQSSIVEGNVFSNGSIVAGTGSGQTITGSAEIAGNGNKIEDITVQGDTRVHTCKDSTIGGTLSYVSGGSVVNCSVGGSINILPNEIDPKPLPISDTQLSAWKTQAATGGVFVDNYTLSGTATASLGPRKIEGNLTLNNQAVLTLTGTLWVTGNVSLNNQAIVRLDPTAYGATSGVLITDGIVDLGNSVTVQGSGQPGSYLMLLTTNPANPAMQVKNSATAGVFYASQGYISISNNVFLREVTAYGLTLGNSATVQYDVGLANLFFTSGPSGGWEIKSWQEIE